MGLIVALKPVDNYSAYKFCFGLSSVCTTLCLFGVYVKLGASRAWALCHGLHHCSNGVVADCLATTCSALAYKWSLCFKIEYCILSLNLLSVVAGHAMNGMCLSQGLR